MKLFTVLWITLCSFSLFAGDMAGPCRDQKEPSNPTEGQPFSDMQVNEKSETAFCFDPLVNAEGKELIDDFNLLSAVGLFDEKNCLIEQNKTEKNEALLLKFMQKNLERKIKVYAVTNPDTRQVNLIFTNSENKNFVETALTAKDKWQIAGFSTASIVVGSFISESLYKGQADKLGHRKMGAKISGLTTVGTYFLLETMGLGDKLSLSKEAKKNLIMMSGPIMGTIAGLLKEVYDLKHKDRHTPDLNDAAATALGAGFPIFSVHYIF